MVHEPPVLPPQPRSPCYQHDGDCDGHSPNFSGFFSSTCGAGSVTTLGAYFPMSKSFIAFEE